MIDFNQQINRYRNKWKDIDDTRNDINSHEQRIIEEKEVIKALNKTLTREKAEMEELENKVIARIRLGDLKDELFSLTGADEIKLFLSLKPQSITGLLTKSQIMRYKNQIKEMYVYIKGTIKDSDKTTERLFKYDLTVPIGLLEKQADGSTLLDCCNIEPKVINFRNDLEEATYLSIRKDMEDNIICNITIKEISELNDNIDRKQFEILTKAINNILEKSYSYDKAKQKVLT